MKSFLTIGDDSKADSSINQIIQGALGKAIILDQADTTVKNLVPEGEFGYYSNKLYFRISGSTYSVNLTLV